jgi:hypothetical protein
MKRAAFLLCLAAGAQPARYAQVAADARGGEVTPPFAAYAAAVTWRGDAHFALRLQTPEGVKTLVRDPDSEPGARHSSGLVYLGGAAGPLIYEPANDASAAALEFVFIDPGPTPAPPREAPSRRSPSEVRAAGKPPMITRAEWGARAPTSTPATTTVTHLIVHHTADSPPASGDFAAWVRAIQIYHQNSNGWADIGYNFLVAPNGLLFEGRGDGVLGAHFSGVNTGTMGASVLGTYTAAIPPPAALQTLHALLAWQAERWKLDPAKSSYHASSQLELAVISGHRDANPSPRATGTTECPGNAFYPLLPETRRAVAALLAAPAPYLVSRAAPDLEGWYLEGLWHVSSRRSVGAPASWYYGDPGSLTYATGTRSNSGFLTSPEFTLDRDAVLAFYSWYDTENETGEWDEKSVEVSVNGGPWRRIELIRGPRREWMPFRVQLRERGSVRLRFKFDTIDGALNDFEGWYVDDIVVTPE